MKNVEHLSHAFLLGLVLYVIMTQFMGQPYEKACGRSMILASCALIYMIMFGHKFPPGKINSSLGF
tara:strand:- start:68 stop:265 length:198 start_codon:yes stop_codon:yes gene_type:complete